MTQMIWLLRKELRNALKEPPPQKTIVIEAKRLGKTSDGNTSALEVDYVRKTNGNCLTDE